MTGTALSTIPVITILKGQQSGFKNLILSFAQQDCLKVTKKLAGFSFYLSFHLAAMQRLHSNAVAFAYRLRPMARLFMTVVHRPL